MSELRIRSLTVAQAMQWFPCGLRLWRRRLREATPPAAVFALLLVALRAIPVLGDVLLLLVLPSVVTSYLIQVHVLAHTGTRYPPGPRPKAASARAAGEAWLRELRQALLGAWYNTQNIFPLVLVGLLLVVVGLVAYALFNAVGGQAAVSPYPFFELTVVQMLRLLLAYAAAGLLWLAVAALLLWALPLFAIRDIALVSALGLNFKALVRNPAPVAVYLLLLAALLLPPALLRLFSPLAGLFAQWLGLTVLALAVGFSGYCSYRLVFAESESPRES